MKAFSLTTLLTVGFVAVFSLESGAQGPGTPPPNYQNPGSAMPPVGGPSWGPAFAYPCPGKTGEPQYDACVRRQITDANNADLDYKLKMRQLTGDCKPEEFNKAYGEFSKACGPAMGTFRAMGSFFADAEPKNCAGYINQCAKCRGGDMSCGGNIDLDDTGSDGESDAQARGVPLPGLFGGPAAANSDSYRRNMESASMCDFPDPEEVKGARERVREYRKERLENEKKVMDANNKLMDISQERQDRLNKLESRAENARVRAQREINEIKKSQKAKEAAVIDQIMKLENDLNNAEANIRRIERSKQQAEITYLEAQAALDRQCHALALTRTEQLRKETLDKMAKSEYSASGAASLFRGLSKTQRAKYQQKAREEYLRCKQDQSFGSAVASAARAKELAIKTADDEIENLKKAQETIKERTKDLQTRVISDIGKETLDEMRSVSQAMTADFNSIDREYNSITNKSGIDIWKNMQDVNQAQANLARGERDNQDDEALAAMGRRLRIKGKSNSVEEAEDALRNMRRSAPTIARTCCAAVETSNQNNRVNDSACSTACGLLPPGEGRTAYNCPFKTGGPGPEPGSADGIK
jgi:hypothetical protein